MSSNSKGNGPCLQDFVHSVVSQYLADMGDTPPNDLHQFIMSRTERPLIEAVLAHTEGNQSRAAGILGITRTTLRNRIHRYQIDQ